MSGLRSAYEATKAKATEELLRWQLLRRYRADAVLGPRITQVMELAPEQVAQGITGVDPRSIPSNPQFVSSGWAEHMLLRYLLALDACAGKSVLDSCCGLGWGSHLVASVASRVVGVDLDSASIAFCTQRWGSDNLGFQLGSVLDLPFESQSFDVVLCMDAIEHFTRADGERYVQELARVCRAGGSIFGSSGFPETREGADQLCRRNPHHLYVYTREEMLQLLRRSFGKPGSVTRHYFRATKD
jgi:2-polyprenyl-3-methyl-5-hydroxy-6-metoxy-1,4-benzoquinol methylase